MKKSTIKNNKNISEKQYKFVWDSIGTIATKFILVVLKMGVSVVTSRVLGPAGRGLFYASIQTTGMANTIGTLSMGEALVYMISRGQITIRNVIGVVIFLTTICTIVVCGSIFLLQPLLQSTFLKAIPHPLFIYIYLLVPILIFEYFANSSLRGLKRFGTSNILVIVTRGILLITIAFALITYKRDVETTLMAYTIATGMCIGLYLFTLFNYSERNISVPWSSLLSIVRYGGATHIGMLLNEMEYRFDIFLLLYFLSPREVGIYSVGVTLAQLLWYITNSINNVLFPEIASHEKDTGTRFFKRILKYVFYANIFVGILLIFGGYPFVWILYGTPFIDAYYVFLFLLPGLIADVVTRTLASWIKGIGTPIILSYVSGVTLTINIALNCLFIPMYGIIGAALSSTITYSLRAIILLSIFCRKTNSSIWHLFTFGKVEWFEMKDILVGVIFKRMTNLSRVVNR